MSASQPIELLREMFVIFVMAKFMGEVFERMKLPAVLGEILAGVLLGPYALGVIHPSVSVLSIAELGAVFLLFMVGLETQPGELITIGPKALQVALLGMVVPFGLGFGYLLLRHHLPHEATFVAAAMVATSVGITARVLRDLNVMDAYASRIILGAAVFDDVLGMVLLALVSGLVETGDVHWLQLGVLAAEAIGFVLLLMFVGPRVIARVKPGLDKLWTHNPQLILALAICLGLSAAAQRLGLTAIIGAFFAGMAFAGFADEWRLRPRVDAITEFLAPFFFFTMGARLDLHVFTREVWATATVISLLAIIAKVLGCGLPMLKSGQITALEVGIGMIPRGEVGLIIAVIGLQMGMISQSAYAVVVFMTAATTLVAPPLIRVVFHRERRKVARELPARPIPEPIVATSSSVEPL